MDLDGIELAVATIDDQLLAVNDALDKFGLEHPVQAELVKLRYFAGLTNEEVSEVMGVSVFHRQELLDFLPCLVAQQNRE